MPAAQLPLVLELLHRPPASSERRSRSRLAGLRWAGGPAVGRGARPGPGGPGVQTISCAVPTSGQRKSSSESRGACADEGGMRGGGTDIPTEREEHRYASTRSAILSCCSDRRAKGPYHFVLSG